MTGRGGQPATSAGRGQQPSSGGGSSRGGRNTNLLPVQQQLPPASTRAVRIPARPGCGTIGRKVIVKTNHFLVTLADRDLNHYTVSITPKVSSKKRCRDIMNELVKSYKASHLGDRILAYDGHKSCYTAGELPFSSKDFVVKLVDQDGGARRERQYRVSIKFASKVDVPHLREFLRSNQLDTPQATIRCLHVVLKEKPSQSCEVVGRSFFSPMLGDKRELGNGLEYWTGYYGSLRPTQMGLSLNIDVSAAAFFEPILVSEFVAKYLNQDLTRPFSDQDRIKVETALKGVRIETHYQGHIKRHKISGLSTKEPERHMFQLDELGTQISVAEYFRQKHNVVLEYPFLPAIQAGSKSIRVFPMELCKIVEGQRYSRRLNERQVSALLKANCQRPHERESSIMQMVRHNNYNNDILVNREFGMNVRPELTSIEARVLPAPRLKYHETGQQTFVEPRVGQWNMIDKKMVNGGTVEFWACVNFSRSDVDANRFCRELISMCCSKGMEFNPNPVVPIRSANPSQIERALSDIHSDSSLRLASMKLAGKQLQLLIVILPDVRGSYGKIKRVCETELGIVSQCCQPRQASKYNKQYMENVALKINVKVGGRNNVLAQAISGTMPFLNDRPTIVFGADVTHPQPGEDSIPSIAAVVGSVDWPEVTKYRMQVSAQTPREEIIQDLYSMTREDAKGGQVHGGMIRELLIAFYKSTNRKPERIIFYRDGVGEGQFEQVLLWEMDAIRKACLSLEENYLPRVTFVVVQKRHHTRLFPANHGDRRTTDRSGNILPGTVVDTKICHPSEFDFYLCSHPGKRGTSRPKHYHVLYDENGFSANALQYLTNSMCYTYARCTRSLSIVPPANYAHLAAFRARYYIESDAAGTTWGRNREVQPLPVIRNNVKDVMFYC